MSFCKEFLEPSSALAKCFPLHHRKGKAPGFCVPVEVQVKWMGKASNFNLFFYVSRALHETETKRI